MQPYLLSPGERLRHWKIFRSSLDDTLTDEEHLLMTARYWQQYPQVGRYIDPYDPAQWPTPWEMLYENQYCLSSLSYMMEQTLLKSADGRWNSDRLKLLYIDSKELSEEFIVLVADNKYVVNYELDRIINFDNVSKMCLTRLEYLLNDNIHIIV